MNAQRPAPRDQARQDAPAETGLTDEFRAAAEALDDELRRLRGLLFAARRLALDLPDVPPETEAVGALIDTAEAAVDAAQDAKDCAWQAQGGS